MRWTPCSDDARVATGEKVIVCVLFQEFSEPDEIGINTCLILQNMLDVTVTALAVQKKENIPIEWRDLWKLWFLIIVTQHLPHVSGWKTNISGEGLCTYSQRLCYDLYDLIIFIWSIFIVVIVVVIWYCNIYHYIFRGVNQSLWNTIAKYINKFS